MCNNMFMLSAKKVRYSKMNLLIDKKNLVQVMIKTGPSHNKYGLQTLDQFWLKHNFIFDYLTFLFNISFIV